MKNVYATMAGLVLNLLVKTGDQLNSGEDAAILESMKMQVAIQAIDSGIVKEIKVNIGDFVNEGDVLIVLE